MLFRNNIDKGKYVNYTIILHLFEIFGKYFNKVYEIMITL